MRSYKLIAMLGATLCLGSGCIGRLIREGVGAVTGAAGKVVNIQDAVDLSAYKGLHVAGVTVSPGFSVPDNVPGMIAEQWTKAGDACSLTPDGEPALVVRGEIIHYEMGGAVDQAIGPLQEIIIRARLTDAKSGAVLGEANLIGRAKATTESGQKHLSAGLGKALRMWFTAHGLKVKKKQAEKADEADGESNDSRKN